HPTESDRAKEPGAEAEVDLHAVDRPHGSQADDRVGAGLGGAEPDAAAGPEAEVRRPAISVPQERDGLVIEVGGAVCRPPSLEPDAQVAAEGPAQVRAAFPLAEYAETAALGNQAERVD